MAQDRRYFLRGKLEGTVSDKEKMPAAWGGEQGTEQSRQSVADRAPGSLADEGGVCRKPHPGQPCLRGSALRKNDIVFPEEAGHARPEAKMRQLVAATEAGSIRRRGDRRWRRIPCVRKLLQQCGQHIARGNSLKDSVAHLHGKRIEDDGLIRGDALAEVAAGRVEKAHAHHQKAVRFLDGRNRFRSAGSTGVNAAIERMLFIESASAAEDAGEGNAATLAQAAKQRPESETVRIRIHQQSRTPRLLDAVRNQIDGSLQLKRVGDADSHIECGFRRLDFQVGNVGGKLQIDWPFFSKAGCQQAVDLDCRVGRRDASLRRCELAQAGHHVVKLTGSRGVMQNGAAMDCVQGRHAADANDRHVLGVGAGDAVEGAEIAHPIRDQQGGNAVDARVTVGGIRSIQFIAGANPFDAIELEKLFEEGKVEVARHANEVPHSDLVNALQQIVSNGDLRHGDRISPRILVKRMCRWRWVGGQSSSTIAVPRNHLR